MKPNRWHFRAWDEEHHKMLTSKRNGDTHAISFDGTLCEGYTDGDMIQIDFNKGFILMQSTGLADKNGKEIFEGDIVEFGCDSWTHSEVGSIVWDECEAGFKIDKDPEFPLLWGNLGDVEIIGNIYENPELLEK